MFKYILLLLSLVCVSHPAVAELYKWVGADGKITYSDTPPPPDAKKVEKKRLNDRVTEGDGLGFATRNAMKKYPVVLFATDCGRPCDQGRALLNKRGVPFTEKNPEKNLADGKELKKLTGALEVPDLQVGKDTAIKGFNEAAWNAALDAAGYPKNAAPLKTTPATAAQNTSAGDAKKKSRSEDIGTGGDKFGPTGNAEGDSNNASGSSQNQSNAPAGKAPTQNARSGPYHEPDMPKNNRAPVRASAGKTPEQRAAEDQ